MVTPSTSPPPPSSLGRWRPWGSAVATVGIVGVLMIPGSSVPSVGFDGIDAVAHVLLFGVWALVVQWEFALRYGKLLALSAGFALATELLQTVAIDRAFAVSDIAADMVGASLGGLFAAWLRGRLLQPGE